MKLPYLICSLFLCILLSFRMSGQGISLSYDYSVKFKDGVSENIPFGGSISYLSGGKKLILKGAFSFSNRRSALDIITSQLTGSPEFADGIITENTYALPAGLYYTILENHKIDILFGLTIAPTLLIEKIKMTLYYSNYEVASQKKTHYNYLSVKPSIRIYYDINPGYKIFFEPAYSQYLIRNYSGFSQFTVSFGLSYFFVKD